MMLILPREFVWRDLESIDDFIRLDPVNLDFYRVFESLREEPFAIQADAVKVFNEAYYQTTHIVNRFYNFYNVSDYEYEIKANLGWQYSTELVMPMIYWLLMLARKRCLGHSYWAKNIPEAYGKSRFWGSFQDRFSDFSRSRLRMDYSFRPSPINASLVREKFYRWENITGLFSERNIEKLLNLWQDNSEKVIIGMLLMDYVESNHFSAQKKQRVSNVVNRTLAQAFGHREEAATAPNPFPTISHQTASAAEEALKREKARLEDRIAQLETELEKARSFAAKNTEAKEPAERSFSLSLIVDYCMKRVSWDEVMHIVAMLNRLLRGVSTKEDAALVDSIEESFRKRAMGNVTMQNPTINGPIYGISGNGNVNLGGQKNE